MKKTSLLAILSILIASAFMYFAVNALAKNYLNKPATQETVSCRRSGTMHKVIIQNGVAIPKSTTAKRCDKLTITNQDDRIRLMAFGVHEKHQPYDGVFERALQKDQSLTVTLNKVGTFKFHDHIDDQAQGTFRVSSLRETN